MTCPRCGSENDADRKFCGECGARLAVVCAACGTPNAPGAKFCGECGTRLDAAPVPASAPAVAELRMVSVLFVDLVGYTSLAESRDAEDVRELLSRYFDTARTIVGRYGGVVEKFIGDAVMALWGTPAAREDDAELAVRAALDLVEAVEAFGASAGVPDLRARAGVVTGQVASVATPDEGLVVGDRVNTAARVQSAARPGTVYAEEVTRHAAAAAIAFEDAGEHVVKGKAEPLRLWRAVRPVAGVGGAGASEQSEAPFVGRDTELRMLKDLFHGAVDRGAARLIIVSGAPGVGKSRLRREFEHYIDGLADTVLWHSGRCLAYGSGAAYWALAEMVRQRLGIAEDTPREEAERKLELGLERWILDPAERRYIAPRVGALLGFGEPGLDRQELFAGWRLLIERLADHSPVVLAFEDAHWADAGLLDFVDHLQSWSAQKPIVILAIARPELAERRPSWAVGRTGVAPLFLEPLADGAVAELLDTLVAGLPATLARRIVARAEGVPLYALETVRALADRGELRPGGDGRLELVGDVAELEVPPTLSSLLTARLDALAPPERALIKTMSVFGGSFPRLAAVALAGRSEAEVDAALAALTAKQVLVVRADPLSPDRGQYAFAQTLLRTVAHDMLGRRERKPLHLAAAEYLRSAFPDQGEEVAEVIAAHHLEALRAAAGDPDEAAVRAGALEALRRAARRAEAVGAPESAERAYRDALGLAASEQERAELTAGAGRMATRAGRHEEAIALFGRAAEAHEAAGRTREAARLAGQAGLPLRYLGRLDEAIERIQAALAVLGPDDLDPDVAELNLQLGTAAAFAGRPEEATVSIERALTAAEALALPAILSSALSSAATILHFSGRQEQSRGLDEAAAGLAGRHGLNHERMRALSNLGELHLARDDPAAEQVITEALALAGRLGDRGFESVAAGNLMEVHLLRGRWGEVRRLAGELLDAEGEHPDGGYLHHRLAMLEALCGDVATATGHLDRLEPWRTTEDIEDRQIYEATAITVALAAGRTAEAAERGLAAARTSVAEFGASHSVVRLVWPDALDAALAGGDHTAAAELLELLGRQPPGRISPFMHAQAARGRALTGAEPDAEAGLRAAAAAFAELGYPHWRARVQTELAAWLIDRGRAGEAAEPLQEATAALEALGAAPALGAAEALRARGPRVST